MENVAQPEGARKKSFVLHLSADVLKTLTAKEQCLWVALRRLADAKTGELRFGDNWFNATRFDREAGMCPRTRKPVMRALADKGLVRMEPVYAQRVIADRLTGHRRNRKVRIGFHYFVAESPRKDWASTKVQDETPHKQRRSTKVQTENNSTKGQSLPGARIAPSKSFTTPVSDRSDSGAPSVGSGSDISTRKSSSSSPARRDDDDLYKMFSQERPYLLLWFTEIVRNRARKMGKQIASIELYMRGALPSLLAEDLSEEIEYWRDSRIFAEVIKEQEQCTPAPLIIEDPYGPVDAVRLAQLAAEDPGCLEHYMTDGGVAVMVFADGIQEIHPGFDEPVWHPF